ncbi:hypothetical protein OE88DRAFT_649628 [Heliocybe sulcata]|uniref:Uncharacterized protein n=1 Tax=Heliocybe sulcata TaxID=5364 RepID=A0A5C3NEC6_9AGAM|nr:hypothetical protein OE88DRAFT_649628 [Heliocybe sulcata]
MSSFSKRPLTETARHDLTSSNAPGNAFLSDDVYARLRNVGSRVRKSVTEGYNTHRYTGTPPDDETSNAQTLMRETSGPIFTSSNATLHQVFGGTDGGPAAVSSCLKRSRSFSEEEHHLTDPENGDVDMLNESQALDETSTSPSKRIIKPLRRNKGFKQVQSLPEGLLSMGLGSSRGTSAPSQNPAVVEEDWSQECFQTPDIAPLPAAPYRE